MQCQIERCFHSVFVQSSKNVRKQEETDTWRV